MGSASTEPVTDSRRRSTRAMTSSHLHQSVLSVKATLLPNRFRQLSCCLCRLIKVVSPVCSAARNARSWDCGVRKRTLSVVEKGGSFLEEEIQLIVVYPVTRLGYRNQPTISYSPDSSIVFRHRREAFETPEEQRGRGDSTINLCGVRNVVTVGRKSANVIIELPHHAAVCVPVRAVSREMARNFVRKVRVRLLHASNCRVQTRITSRLSFFHLAHTFNPAAKALGCGTMNAMTLGKTNPFNRDSFANAIRIQTRVVQHDDSTERMSNQADGEVADDVQQHRKVQNMFRDAIHSARRPGTVAVAAEIQSVGVIVLAQ